MFQRIAIDGRKRHGGAAIQCLYPHLLKTEYRVVWPTRAFSSAGCVIIPVFLPGLDKANAPTDILLFHGLDVPSRHHRQGLSSTVIEAEDPKKSGYGWKQAIIYIRGEALLRSEESESLR